MLNKVFLFFAILVCYHLIIADPSAQVANVYLQKPTGQYGIGFVEYHLVNKEKCPNPFYNKKNAKQFSVSNVRHCNELWLKIYYPSSVHQTSPYALIPTLKNDLQQIVGTLNTKTLDTINQLPSYSAPNLPIVSTVRFPLILFSPGYGVRAAGYENIITHLVSHGYIVAAVNSQFINGNLPLTNDHLASLIIPHTQRQKRDLFVNSLSDLQYAYTYIKNKKIAQPIYSAIDFRRVGLLGHSLGAATVAHMAKAMPTSFYAIATLDLIMDFLNENTCDTKISLPFLHMFSSQVYAAKRIKRFPFWCKRQQRLAHQTLIVLANAHNDADYTRHMSYCDYSTLQYQPDIARALSIAFRNPQNRFLGNGNGWRITVEINHALLKFFNAFYQVPHQSPSVINQHKFYQQTLPLN